MNNSFKNFLLGITLTLSVGLLYDKVNHQEQSLADTPQKSEKPIIVYKTKPVIVYKQLEKSPQSNKEPEKVAVHKEKSTKTKISVVSE